MSADDQIARLQVSLAELAREREWEQFHDAKNLAMLIASEAGELLAEYRWLRSDDADSYTDEPSARERVESEIADVTIGVLNLCRRLNIDLGAVVERKLAKVRANYPVASAKGRADRRRERSGQTH
jgi:dCTP diphosphatase